MKLGSAVAVGAFLAVVLLAHSATAFYAGTDVIELTPKNFDSMVLQGPDVWVVEFYAEWCTSRHRAATELAFGDGSGKVIVAPTSACLLGWCVGAGGHCKNLAPEYKKVASELKGIVKIGAVNADTHRELGAYVLVVCACVPATWKMAHTQSGR